MSAVEKEQPEAAKTRFAKDQFKAFVERIERLEEEKRRSPTISATSMRNPRPTAST